MAIPGGTIRGYFLVENLYGNPVDSDPAPVVDVRRNGISAGVAATTHPQTGEYGYSFAVPLDWAPGDLIVFVADVYIDGELYQTAVGRFTLKSAVTQPGAAIDEIEVVRPEVARMEAPVPQRRQAVLVRQGQLATIEIQFRDDVGRPLDLSDYVPSVQPGSSLSSSSSSSSGTDYEFIVRFQEPFESSKVAIEAEAYVYRASTGLLRYEIPEEVVQVSQILYAYVGVFKSGRLVRVLETIVIVDRSAFGDGYRRVGVPPVSEVRSRLRDSGINDNYLLARVEHSLDEIAEATIKAVADWNHWAKNAGVRTATTKNFSEPDNLMDGVMANLYPMLADNYRRNHLAYQAAGVSVNDKDYGDIYDKLAQSHRLSFNQTARRTVAAQSRQGWNGIVNSVYPYSRSNNRGV